MGFEKARHSTNLALYTTIFTLIAGYLFYLVIARLYLSPLAKFPGPKLAALTRWYEFYYEVVRKGQFSFHIQDLHKQYGPIIRVTPDELHVRDSHYYDELYIKSGRLDKYEWVSGRFGNNDSIFTTASDELHRTRRAPLAPMFSKKRIVDFQPVIREKLDKLCLKIAQYGHSGLPFNIRNAWTALAGDIITEYAFARSYDHLDVPDFQETFHDGFIAASESGHLTLHFPFIYPLMNSLPDWLILKMQPLLYLLIRLQRDLKQQVKEIAEGINESPKYVTHPTIFHELLSGNLPAQEKSLPRLNHEAQTIIGAGLVTISWTLTVGSFHIVNSPEIFRKLRDELSHAIPDLMVPLDCLKLEQLPYLTACVKESLRLSYGITGRIQRLSPTPIRYEKWVIPPRTPVSMNIIDVHHDEEIFPDSNSFIPERWLDSPKTKNGSSLDRYLVAFGKGSRSCLGINMAYAELSMALAAVFRRFTFELFETDVSDVALAHDYFVPQVKLDSKGVRVKVKSIDA